MRIYNKKRRKTAKQQKILDGQPLLSPPKEAS